MSKTSTSLALRLFEPPLSAAAGVVKGGLVLHPQKARKGSESPFSSRSAVLPKDQRWQCEPVTESSQSPNQTVAPADNLSAVLVSTPSRIRGRVGRRALALFTFLSVFLAAAAPTASAQVLKKLDFETGDSASRRASRHSPAGSTSLPTPVRQGQFASRFTVKPGDLPVPGGERAELVYWSRERAGKTSWWRWSTYFPGASTRTRARGTSSRSGTRPATSVHRRFASWWTST